MKNTLEHYTLKMEKMIYEDTRVLRGRNTVCNGQIKLPCNCLTGLTINYLGYMIKNCWCEDLDCTLEVSDDMPYVLSKYQGQKLSPVLSKDKNSQAFLMDTFICNKKFVSNDKVYICIDSYQNVEELDQRIANTARNMKRRIHEAEIISDFMLYFLKAIRIKPIGMESKSLLAMSLFLHPNETSKLLHDFLSNQNIPLNDHIELKEFFENYLKFLKELKIESQIGYDYGFLFTFSSSFENLSKVYIGNWIEKIVRDKGAVFVSQVFYAACNRNKEELNRRRSYFNWLKTKLEIS